MLKKVSLTVLMGYCAALSAGPTPCIAPLQVTATIEAPPPVQLDTVVVAGMVTNADAWAKGEVHNISFSALAKRNSLCADAMMSPEFSIMYGLPNIEKSVADLWFKHALASLARNAVTVAFVPMEYLTGPNSYLDRLRAEGYTVSAP